MLAGSDFPGSKTHMTECAWAILCDYALPAPPHHTGQGPLTGRLQPQPTTGAGLKSAGSPRPALRGANAEAVSRGEMRKQTYASLWTHGSFAA
jgi:hypothetical protein